MNTRRRLFLGSIVAVVAVAMMALPGFAAKPTGAKSFGMSVTTTLPGVQPVSRDAQSGVSTTYYAYITNTSPGNSNPNSFEITAPAGFTVTNASIYAASNVNAASAVTSTGSTVTVTGLDPLKNFSTSGQYLTVAITATVPTSTTCGTSSTYVWTAVGYTGSNLSGDAFTQNTGNSTTSVTLSCSLSFDPAPANGVINSDVTTTVKVAGGSGTVNVTLTVTSKPTGATVTIVGAATNSAPATFTLRGDTTGTYAVKASATGFTDITASFDLFGDGIDCGKSDGVTDTNPATTDVTFQRTDNGGSGGCVEVPYTLTTNGNDEVQLLKDEATVRSEGAKFILTITWGAPAGAYPNFGTTTFDVDGNPATTNDRFTPDGCDVVGGQPQYPINPTGTGTYWPGQGAAKPWCVGGVLIQPSGNDYYVTETFYGAGDPLIKRSF